MIDPVRLGSPYFFSSAVGNTIMIVRHASSITLIGDAPHDISSIGMS